MHDYVINFYNVNLMEKTLNIYISHRNGQKKQIVVTGVLTHFFENILEENILLSIEEFQIKDFFKEQHEELELRKNCCWPIDYQNIDELMKFLNENAYVYIKIYSSFGMYGWIIAKHIMVKELDENYEHKN